MGDVVVGEPQVIQQREKTYVCVINKNIKLNLKKKPDLVQNQVPGCF